MRVLARALTALVLLLQASLGSAQVSYRVIDRRAEDGSVVLVRRVPAGHPGELPFRAGALWKLEPVTDLFRVRGVPIPARGFQALGDPPAVTLRAGDVVANSWTTAAGGGGTTTLEPGEVVRLVRLNSALKTVRMDLEAVCRRSPRGWPLTGRVDFVLSGQVGKQTFDEANAAVAAELEPVALAEVMEICDPETGSPPARVRPGQPIAEVAGALGEPRRRSETSAGEVWDYGVVELQVRSGAVVAIRIPALD
jgi:hypothetical protein